MKPYLLDITEQHIENQQDPSSCFLCAIAKALNAEGKNLRAFDTEVWFENILVSGKNYDCSQGVNKWQRDNNKGFASPTTLVFDPRTEIVCLLDEWSGEPLDAL